MHFQISQSFLPARQKKSGRAECKWEDSAFHELSLAFERTHRSKKDFFREKQTKQKQKTTTTTRNKQKNGEQEPSRTNRLTSYWCSLLARIQRCSPACENGRNAPFWFKCLTLSSSFNSFVIWRLSAHRNLNCQNSSKSLNLCKGFVLSRKIRFLRSSLWRWHSRIRVAIFNSVTSSG